MLFAMYQTILVFLSALVLVSCQGDLLLVAAKGFSSSSSASSLGSTNTGVPSLTNLPAGLGSIFKAKNETDPLPPESELNATVANLNLTENAGDCTKKAGAKQGPGVSLRGVELDGFVHTPLEHGLERQVGERGEGETFGGP